MPGAARAINVAQNRGWLDLISDTAVALASLVGHLLGGGSITKRNYVPSISEGQRISTSDIKKAFGQVGVQSELRHKDSDNQATEVVPTEYGSIL